MAQHGNLTTYNVENVLRSNIINSEYFRDTCAKLSTWTEVVDEIFYSVDHVEPWMSGNARGASTAFCLLYRSVRLIRLTSVQMSTHICGLLSSF
jgi:pre-mRNA-splicing factor 38B